MTRKIKNKELLKAISTNDKPNIGRLLIEISRIVAQNHFADSPYRYDIQQTMIEKMYLELLEFDSKVVNNAFGFFYTVAKNAGLNYIKTETTHQYYDNNSLDNIRHNNER